MIPEQSPPEPRPQSSLEKACTPNHRSHSGKAGKVATRRPIPAASTAACPKTSRTSRGSTAPRKTAPATTMDPLTVIAANLPTTLLVVVVAAALLLLLLLLLQSALLPLQTRLRRLHLHRKPEHRITGTLPASCCGGIWTSTSPQWMRRGAAPRSIPRPKSLRPRSARPTGALCVAKGVEIPAKRTLRRIDSRRRNPIVTAVVALVALLQAMPMVGTAATATPAAKVAAAAVVAGRCPNHRCFGSGVTAAWAAAWSRLQEVLEVVL